MNSYLRLRGHPLIEPLFLTLLLAAVFGWVYRDFFAGPPLMAGDLGPWYVSPADAWAHYTNAWTDTNLGWANPLLHTWAVLQVVLTSIVGDAAVAQRLFFLSLMPLSVVSMYLLLRYLMVSSAVRIPVAFVYGVNGASIAWFAIGAYPSLSVQAVFPLLLLFFMKFLQEPEHRLRNILVFTALVSFETGVMPYLIIRIPLILLAVAAVVFIRARSGKWLVSTGAGIALAAGVYVALTLPLTFIQAGLAGEALLRDAGDTIGGLASSRNVTETIGAAFRAYNTPFVYRQLIYAMAPMLLLIAVIPVVRSLRARTLYFSMLFVAAISLLSMHLISLGAGDWVFRTFPFLFPFKDPIKLHTMFLQPLFIAIALIMDIVARHPPPSSFLLFRLPQPERLSKLMVPALGVGIIFLGIFGITTSGHPPYDNPTGNLRRFLTTGLEKGGEGAYEVPIAFTSAAEWVQQRREQEDFFRTLWLPQNRYLQRNVLPILDPASFRYPKDTELGRLVLDPLFNSQPGELGDRLGEFSVKYVIVVEPDWNYTSWQTTVDGPPSQVLTPEQGYVAIGDPEWYLQQLSRQTGLRLIHAEPGFSVFHNEAYLPHATVYSKVLAVAPKDALEGEADADRMWEKYDLELLSNSDFSEGVEGWSVIGGAEVQFAVVEDGTGTSLQISSPRAPQFGAAIQEAPITEGEYYLLSISARGENTGGGAAFRIFYEDGSGEALPFEGKDFQRIWFDLGASYSTHRFFLAPPAGSRIARIYAEGFGVPDAQQPALTFFDFVSLITFPSRVVSPAFLQSVIGTLPEGVQVPLLEEQPQTLLASLPGYAPSQTLFRLGDSEAEAAQELASSADVVVFLDNPRLDPVDESWVKEAKRLLILYEAESAVQVSVPRTRPTDGLPVLVTGNANEYSSLGALHLIGERTVNLSVNLPATSQYRLLVRGRFVDPVFTVGNQGYPAKRISDGEGPVAWYESDPIPMMSGPHPVTLSYTGAEALIDQFAVFRPGSANETLFEAMASHRVESTFKQTSLSSFELSVSTDGPFTILLREQYDPDWEAKAGQTSLQHIQAGTLGWANAFVADNASKETVVIQFGAQGSRDIQIVVWSIAWLIVAVLIIVLSLPPKLTRPFVRLVQERSRSLPWNRAA